MLVTSLMSASSQVTFFIYCARREKMALCFSFASNQGKASQQRALEGHWDRKRLPCASPDRLLKHALLFYPQAPAVQVASPLGPSVHRDHPCPGAGGFPHHSFGHLCSKFQGAIFPLGGLPLCLQILRMWQLTCHFIICVSSPDGVSGSVCVSLPCTFSLYVLFLHF